MEVALIGTISTIVAGIAGWFGNNLVSQYLQRPKTKINLHNVFLQSDILVSSRKDKDHCKSCLKNSGIFKVPEEIRNKLEGCEYVGKPEKYYDNRDNYIEYLMDVKKQIEVQEFLFEEVPKVLNDLEINLNTNMMKEFKNNWMKIQETLNYIFIRCNRKGETINFKFDDKVEYLLDLNSTDDENYHINVEDKVKISKKVLNLTELRRDGETYIFYYNSDFIWFKYGREGNKIKKFGQRLLACILLEDREQLLRVIEFLKALNWNDFNLHEAKKVVESELQGFDRILIKGMFVNSGRMPIAIKGQGYVKINSAGFKFYDDSRLIEVKEDISIPVCITNIDKKVYESTVIVNGGQAVPFTAQSMEFMKNMKGDLNIILRAMYNMERICLVEFIRLDNNKDITSNEIVYRNFDENDPLLK